MNRDFFRIVMFFLIVLSITGCATTRPRSAVPDSNAQIAAMQTQLQAKDQEIQDLRSQIESQTQSLSSNFASTASGDKYKILRVPGVSAADVQKALLRAGLDPGPVDGRLGKKTRSAVKAFQRQHHLTADGVVGERTWTALHSA